MMTALFREHPYGSPEYGYADEIDNINRKSIKNNWESYVNESKISIVATGAISESDAIRYSQQIVDKMCSNVTEKDIEEIPRREQNRLVLVDYDSDNQSLIRVGKPTINILDENYAALSLLNVLYGGYFMSRLNNLIREQKGLSYGVHSSLSSAKCTGLLGVGTSVKAANTQEVVNDIIEEMSLLSNEMLEEEELKRAKNYFLGSFLRSAESYKQISKMLVTMTLNGLPDNYYDDFYSKIRRIRSDDLFSAQIDLLKPEGLVIAIAGKVDNIAPQFDQFIDKYDLLDAEGKILNRTENNS
jgi:predicted Zn-dependent peptidase